MSEAKPYVIPKQLVWEAYQRVKANRGAAGVDGESLAAFEKDLKGNLYKIWNRMSSGSYCNGSQSFPWIFSRKFRLLSRIPAGSCSTFPHVCLEVVG